MGRPRTVYRGKRKYGWIITLLLFLVIFAFMAVIGLFYYLQNFIVYDKDGLSLVLPSAGSAAGEPQEEYIPVADPVDAEVVVTAPDFSDLKSMVGADIPAIKAKYVTAENATAANLNYYSATAPELGADTLVIQLKPASGLLSYFSTVPAAGSYGVNGTENLSDALASLSAKGIYLVADISCLVDDCMAVRNAPLALRDGSGGVLSDSRGAWLDPYNPGTREYLAALLAEIAGMGFDEVLLTNLAYPKATVVSFSQAMSYAPDPVSCVSSLGLFLRQEADKLGIRLAAEADGAALRSGESAALGQDMEFFLKVFDHVFIATDAANCAGDMAAFQALMPSAAPGRIVPSVSGFTPESASYLFR